MYSILESETVILFGIHLKKQIQTEVLSVKLVPAGRGTFIYFFLVVTNLYLDTYIFYCMDFKAFSHMHLLDITFLNFLSRSHVYSGV